MFGFGKKKDEAKLASPTPIALGKGNPGVFDEPKNELEKAIIAVRNRELPAPKFIEYFLNSTVYVAVPAGQFQKTEKGISLVQNPTLFTITYPEYTCLCFYSHESRLKPTYDQFPDFKYAVAICAGDLIIGIQNHIGLVINPYYDINLEWNADQVARIKEMIKG
jgi:hypothetical protein